VGYELAGKINVVNCEVGKKHRDNLDIVLHVIRRWLTDFWVTFAPNGPQQLSNLLPWICSKTAVNNVGPLTLGNPCKNRFPGMRDAGFLDELLDKRVRIKPLHRVPRNPVNILTQRADGK
jgi:hypothetical protein